MSSVCLSWVLSAKLNPSTDLHRQSSSTSNWYRLYQGWRTSGTRTINGMRQNILGTPAIKMVCILFQNNKVHSEVLRTNAAGSTLVCYCLALVTSWTTVAYDVKFVYA
ncbi:hypothetical protein TNCV_158761 [Trichonephila clavipes]|uniref:Uncharacterized protein n=1 Tax=Trichonephila clavipes TaxID=2585209 RepID=A0A8X6R452_TRICX|nr:hypothetical protein TNCV_158761 [Trichonephila clavipes]